LEPLLPAVAVAQLKPLIVVVPLLNPVLPGVLAVTVTVFELALAVTVAELHRLMAAARFDASVVVLLLAAKVPLAPEQAFDPFEPVDAVPQERPLVEVPDIAIAPSVVAVAVTVFCPALDVAVAPKLVGHALIEAIMPLTMFPPVLYFPVYDVPEPG
jgi:hypothetical protein